THDGLKKTELHPEPDVLPGFLMMHSVWTQQSKCRSLKSEKSTGTPPDDKIQYGFRTYKRRDISEAQSCRPSERVRRRESLILQAVCRPDDGQI
ncbi:hypothetical protein ATANTOWER_007872, partial [Ataeniobius toweri]|nr:hypothetical protein [Ataeniobius toweri]